MPKHMKQMPSKRRGKGRRTVLLCVAVALIAILGGVYLCVSGGADVGSFLGAVGGDEPQESGGANSQEKGSDDSQMSATDETMMSETGVSSQNASQLEQMLEAGEVSSIRLIGDSITAGYLCDGYDYGATSDVVVYSGPEGTYTETSSSVQCWANDFRSYAASRGVTNFVNAGVNGFRMAYLAESPDSWLGDGADVIVVMLGTNDAAWESVDDFKAYAQTGLAAAARKCKLLVVVSPPNNNRTDARNLYGLDQIDAALTQVCDEQGYLHVSLYDALELGTSDFNPDQVHPTSSGSHKLWLALKNELGLS